jgi:glucose/arabinose dehydrogenase
MKTFCLAIAALIASAVSSFAQPALNDPNLTVTEVVSGINLPSAMAFIGANDFLILEKDSGTVRRVTNGLLQPAPVLSVNVFTAGIASGDEQGLLGIAIHPDFATDPTKRWVYLFYTEGGLDPSDPCFSTFFSTVCNNVYRYDWDAANGILTNPVRILTLMARANFDIGGVMAFGADKKLYVVSGNQGSAFGQLQNNLDPFADPPDDTSVIFRLNEDGTTPADNPFVSVGAPWDRYFAYGIANSFGLALDPVGGKLWDTEIDDFNFVYDEINVVAPGFNSGWLPLMGPLSRTTFTTADLPTTIVQVAGSNYADPVFSWLNSVGLTAIAFLNSQALGSQYFNNAFVGDMNGNLYRFAVNAQRSGFVLTGGLSDLVADDDTETPQVTLGSGFNAITDVKVGPDGKLYLVDFGADVNDGKVYVIAVAPTSGPLTMGATTLAAAEQGVAYAADLGVSGGTPPYTVTLAKGNKLPAGLNFTLTTITGTPSSTRAAKFTVKVTDQAGASVSRTFSISISKAISISTRSLKAGTVGKAYSGAIAVTGGKGPFSWSHTGTLPEDLGLSFDPSTGKITGTPSASGSGSVTFIVTDALGGKTQKALKLTVN